MTQLRLFAFLVVASLLMAACGSGGGTTVVSGGGLVDPNLLFNGNYALVGISGESDGAESIGALFGHGVADGAGLVTIASGRNTLGVIDPIGAPSDADCQVGLDHSLELGLFGPGVSLMRGGISTTGELAAVSVMFGDAQPTLILLGRAPPGVHADTSIQGTWRFAGYSANNAGTLNIATWGSMDFDGAGLGTYEQTINQEGATLGPVKPALIYEVVENGSVGVQLAGGLVLSGRLTGGGQVLILSGGGAAGDPPTMLVLIREASGMNDADLADDYHVVTFQHLVATNGYASFVGALKAGGTGVSNFSGFMNEDGLSTQTGLDGVLSSVAPDGGVTFTTAGGDMLQGAISQDGRYAVAAGSTNAGGDPTFVLLLR